MYSLKYSVCTGFNLTVIPWRLPIPATANKLCMYTISMAADSLVLSYSTVVLYVVIMKVRDFVLLDIYFLTVREDWLGIAKPINVFRSIIDRSIK